MAKQTWRKTGTDYRASQSKFRDALLNNPQVQQALNKYINSLNLQGQVNSGKITEHQALELYDKAIQDFRKGLNNRINETFTKNGLDQTELATPVNMETALTNPDSFASQQAADQIATVQEAQETIAAEITEEVDQQIQVVQQQVTQAAEEEQADMAQQEQNTGGSTSDRAAEDSSAAELIRELEREPDAKKAEESVEKTFEKDTGLSGKFDHAADEKAEKEEKHESAPVPRPRDN